MGYETCLIFVEDYDSKKKKGYTSILATLEMGNICNDKVAELIQSTKKPKEDEERLHKLVEEYETQRKYCWTRDGDYSEELNDMSETNKNKETNKLYRLEKQLDKELHYVYHGSNDQQYEDSYGSALMIVTLEDLKKAIIQDQAKLINDGEYEFGYRRFNIALKMIESFEDKKDWNDNVKVIMWGH